MLGRYAATAFLISTLVVVAACDNARPPATALPGQKGRTQAIILATTTSVQDSGLLDMLLPIFEKRRNVTVKPIAVGTGEALAMGRRGEADIVWVHSPKVEEEFVAEGFGIDRRPVMHNAFVVVGPADDPAKVGEARDTADVFKRIARAKGDFISRGDKSGTHIKEMELWKNAGIEQRDTSWYFEAGCGMGDALVMADNKNAYILTDTSTFAVFKARLRLRILYGGDKTPVNQYSVIRVNPARYPKVKADAAGEFADFVTSPEAQAMIADFGKDKYGESLYVPNAEVK